MKLFELMKIKFKMDGIQGEVLVTFVIYIGLYERNAMTFWPHFFSFFSRITPTRPFVFLLKLISPSTPYPLKISASLSESFENKCENKWRNAMTKKGPKMRGWSVCFLLFCECVPNI